jgi:hypothetical protein
VKYLVVMKSHNVIEKLEQEHLETFKRGIEKALSKGTIEGAYAKVGGGVVLVVNQPGHAELALELRKHHITDAEVIPMVPLVALLDAHIEYRQTGVAKV